MSLFKGLAFDSFAYGLSGILSRMMSFLIFPFVSQVLGPTEYGVIGLVGNLINFLMILFLLGTDAGVMRWYFDSNDEESKKVVINTWFWPYLVLSTILSLLVFAAAPLLSPYIVKEIDITVYLRMVALTLPLFCFQLLCNTLIRLQRKPLLALLYNVPTSILYIILNYYFIVYQKWGLDGFYASYFIYFTLNSALGIAIVYKQLSPKWFRLALYKDIFRFSLPMVPANISIWIVGLSGGYFVQYYFTTADAGIYQIGLILAAAISLATNAFGFAWQPFALSIHKDPEAKHTYARALMLFTAVTSILQLLLLLFSRDLLVLISRPEFADSSWVASAYSLTYIFQGLTSIFVIGLNIVKTNADYGIISVASALLTLVLSFFLIPYFGIYGAVACAVVPKLLSVAFILRQAQRSYPIPYPILHTVVVYSGTIAIGYLTLMLLTWWDIGLAFGVFLKALIAILVIILVGAFVRDRLRQTVLPGNFI